MKDSLITRLKNLVSKLTPVRPVKVTMQNKSIDKTVISKYADGKPMNIQIGLKDYSRGDS
jgi:hypothetical protein